MNKQKIKMNTTDEDKVKIDMLKSAIEDMQEDHAKTFGYKPPMKKSKKIFLAVVSISSVLIIAGIIFVVLSL